MKWKAKYRFSSCPAEKWSAYNVTTDDIEQITAFILPLEKRSTLTSDEVDKMFRLFNKVSGLNTPRSSCPPCVRSVLTDLVKEVRRHQGVIKSEV